MSDAAARLRDEIFGLPFAVEDDAVLRAEAPRAHGAQITGAQRFNLALSIVTERVEPPPRGSRYSVRFAYTLRPNNHDNTVNANAVYDRMTARVRQYANARITASVVAPTGNERQVLFTIPGRAHTGVIRGLADWRLDAVFNAFMHTFEMLYASNELRDPYGTTFWLLVDPNQGGGDADEPAPKRPKTSHKKQDYVKLQQEFRHLNVKGLLYTPTRGVNGLCGWMALSYFFFMKSSAAIPRCPTWPAYTHKDPELMYVRMHSAYLADLSEKLRVYCDGNVTFNVRHIVFTANAKCAGGPRRAKVC